MIDNEQKSEAMKLAEEKYILSLEYVDLGEELVSIKVRKPEFWNEIRQGVKSDAQANRIWDQTELGIKEMEIEQKMRNIKMLSSAIKTKLDVLNWDAHNQW